MDWTCSKKECVLHDSKEVPGRQNRRREKKGDRIRWMDDVEREIWAGQNGYELERPWN
jgi:hypothetical protein